MTDLELNYTSTTDFTNYIPLIVPHETVPIWELKMNIHVQNENKNDVWTRHLSRLVSKTIPSKRIQLEIDQSIMDLSNGYLKIGEHVINQTIPKVLKDLIKTYIPPASARIYNDLWLDAEPEDYDHDKKEITPPPDAPASITNGWVRKYYYEDLQDHLTREAAIVNNIANEIVWW